MKNKDWDKFPSVCRLLVYNVRRKTVRNWVSSFHLSVNLDVRLEAREPVQQRFSPWNPIPFFGSVTVGPSTRWRSDLDGKSGVRCRDVILLRFTIVVYRSLRWMSGPTLPVPEQPLHCLCMNSFLLGLHRECLGRNLPFFYVSTYSRPDALGKGNY